jgi:hypothetical protein
MFALDARGVKRARSFSSYGGAWEQRENYGM